VNGTSILIADHAPTRLGVRMALSGFAVICAEADSAEQAVAEAKRTRPDMCLIGLNLPGGGITAVRGICAAVPNTSVIVLAGVSDVDDLLAAVRAGAVGYVPGDVNAERLRRIVRAVAGREAAVPRSMVLDLLGELRTAEAAGDGRMTAREAQILGMLRRGHSTAGIASRLEISPVTVRRHISEIVRKTGAADRAGLLAENGRSTNPSGAMPGN
jgi:two-component system, NarL family, nitrate/nitrite response regulator NarL